MANVFLNRTADEVNSLLDKTGLLYSKTELDSIIKQLDYRIKKLEGNIEDKTKITLIEVDGEEDTDNVEYFTDLTALRQFLTDNPQADYRFNVGTDSGISTIGNGFFSGISNLKAIIIPENVSIGDRAFQGSGLEKIEIETTTLGNYVFASCTALKSAKINATGVGMFAGCTTLETVNPVSFDVAAYAFNSCSALTSLLFISGVTQIATASFNKSGLYSVNLPEGLVSVGDGAFSSCPNLDSVSIPSTVSSIGNGAFGSPSISQITIFQAQDSVSGSPWGATNATITWEGDS